MEVNWDSTTYNKNTSVQDIEANVSTTTEEDGDILTPREIDSITRSPVTHNTLEKPPFKPFQGLRIINLIPER